MHSFFRFDVPGPRDVALAALLPGAVFGAQVGGLLFFLNPHLPFEPGPVLRTVGHFSLLGALASALVLLPVLWGRPVRARRFMPWVLTLALAGAAVMDWTHASVYTYFLPPGIGVRLIKAAAWLSVAALVVFYTALLHSLHGRPYGLRSRLGLVFLVVFSLYIMAERREAYQLPPPVSPLPSSAEALERRRLVLVGVEGATLDAILPLAEQGYLPFLASLMEEGGYGRLESFTPNRREALWSTLASGRYPYHHRVFGEPSRSAAWLARGARLELLPRLPGFTFWGAVDSSDRRKGASRPAGKVLRLWEVLPRLGEPAGVVGWPLATLHPEGPGRAEASFTIGEGFFVRPWVEGDVQPPELADRARLFRVSPEELDPVALARFGNRPPASVRASMARDLERQTLARFLLEEQRTLQALVLHLPGLGEVSREFFGGFLRAEFEAAQHPDYRAAANHVVRYYAFVDELLHQLHRAAGPDTLFVVVSAFGTQEASGWRAVLSELMGGRPLRGYVEGSPDGLWLMAGPGVAPAELLPDSELVDVMPTVIYALGLPVARDLDGQVVTRAFQRDFLARHPLSFVPSYETLRTEDEKEGHP